MYKTKIITDNKWVLEDSLNDWFTKNPNIKILDISYLFDTNDNDIICTIIYK